jgi:hypothetical protein
LVLGLYIGFTIDELKVEEDIIYFLVLGDFSLFLLEVSICMEYMGAS